MKYFRPSLSRASVKSSIKSRVIGVVKLFLRVVRIAGDDLIQSVQSNLNRLQDRIRGLAIAATTPFVVVGQDFSRFQIRHTSLSRVAR